MYMMKEIWVFNLNKTFIYRFLSVSKIKNMIIFKFKINLLSLTS